MKITAIAIDAWKRKTFEDLLADAGFTFQVEPLTKDGETLAIFLDDIEDSQLIQIALIIAEAQFQCLKKLPTHN